MQVWKAAAEGGPATQVTRKGGYIAFEWADGAALYYAKGLHAPGLWKKALPAGEERALLADYDASAGAWDVGRQGVYFAQLDTTQRPYRRVVRVLPHNGGPATVVAQWPETADRLRDLQVPGLARHLLAVSPDEHWLLSVEMDHVESDIMVAEDLEVRR
jgi:hypothetical protein